MTQIVQAEIPFWDSEVPVPTVEPRSDVVFPIENLMGEILADSNLNESFDDLVSNLENKYQREHHRKKKTEYLKRLKEELATGKFHLDRSELRELHVQDGYKPRIVHAPPVYKRIGVQAIMRVVEKYIYPTLITNTAASIKGRGMHWLHHIVEEDLKADPENMQFYGQSDIFHFYDCIDQALMKQIVREYISDPVVLKYLDNFITLTPSGLSKGLRSSQGLANLHLSDIDKAMCQEVSYHTIEISEGVSGTTVKGKGRIYTDNGDAIHYHYYRYCDDIVFFASTKKECWRLYHILSELLTKKGLRIKASFAIRPISEGLDFLGFKTYAKWVIDKNGEEHWEVYSLIRKRIKQKAARALHRVKSRKRRQQIMGSFKGMACHADCKHLYYKLTGQHMAKFSELGLTFTPKDGKKRFNCQHIPLGQITNRPIEILDFEKDIDTKWGSSRCVVLFHFVGKMTEYKFYTNSEEMKSLLIQMEERGLLPGNVETTIQQKAGTGALRIYSFT